MIPTLPSAKSIPFTGSTTSLLTSGLIATIFHLAVVNSESYADSVKDFGAIGDGQALDTGAIQKAIDAVASAGGGQVNFPPGVYRSGTLMLRSNITLFLENGAVLSGSKELGDFDTDLPHLIYGKDVQSVVITGPGAIDGNGPSFWDKGRLQKWLDGEIELNRPRDMIRFENSKNIRMENTQVKNGPFWHISFERCQDITVRGVRIRSGVYENDGPNTDGINFWNCHKVTVADCDIVSGDDCIVVLGDSRDVVINNCQLQTSETALMISGVRNLSCSNCTIHDSGCGIGFRVWNGILIDGVVINNITMNVTKRYAGGGTAIYAWSYPIYTENETPEETDLPPGVMRNVSISNVNASANGLVCVNGASNGPIDGLTLTNIRLHMFGNKISEYNDDPPYPYPIYGFHNGSPYGMFFRYVNNLKLNEIQISWNRPEKATWGNALRCWMVHDLEVKGLVARHALNSNESTISLKDVESAWIHECQALAGTDTFLELVGECRQIVMSSNDLSKSSTVLLNRANSPIRMQHNVLPKQSDD